MEKKQGIGFLKIPDYLLTFSIIIGIAGQWLPVIHRQTLLV